MLDPFAQLFQHCWGHARSLRMVYKDLGVVSFPRCTAGPKLVGSCCIRLHTTANTDATTPNIVGVALLGVVASVCMQPNTQGSFYHVIENSKISPRAPGPFKTLGECFSFPPLLENLWNLKRIIYCVTEA